MGWNKQDIVEGKGFLQHAHVYFYPSQRAHYTRAAVNGQDVQALID
jgi:hypothetical protein